MSTCTRHLLGCAFVLLLLGVLPATGVSAQTSATDGTYTSPLFNYVVNWDPALWLATEQSSEDGYDLLVIESDGAAVYVEGLAFYQGDRQACIEGERQRIADEAGYQDVQPLVDIDNQPIEGSDGDYTFALYDVPASADGELLPSVVYVECRTLVPGSAVLILTAFVDPADAEAQLDQVFTVAEALVTQPAPAAAAPFDTASVEQLIRRSADDASAMWEGIFAELGLSYVRPAVIAVTGPTETECGDAFPGETGSFYCPADRTIYIDVPDSIDNDLTYGVVFFQVVIAHEVAHHVQELLLLPGCIDPTCGEPESSLAIELQADCFAGVWMQDAATNGEIDPMELGRVEIAVKTFLGDPIDTPPDDPDAHGTGDQRFAMFMAGYDTGVAACGL